ncbi:hypothetical protein FOL46_003124 [Perkinsus olseni]|uniref:Uncharacterized protein n=1 Tax=Perkinsus olseni TaxID=32597 RepID=A0A7J6KLY1_PEROL|nr:hypothetical protein FOL46_003124 [Perkinsus olseni]
MVMEVPVMIAIVWAPRKVEKLREEYKLSLAPQVLMAGVKGLETDWQHRAPVKGPGIKNSFAADLPVISGYGITDGGDGGIPALGRSLRDAGWAAAGWAAAGWAAAAS